MFSPFDKAEISYANASEIAAAKQLRSWLEEAHKPSANVLRCIVSRKTKSIRPLLTGPPVPFDQDLTLRSVDAELDANGLVDDDDARIAYTGGGGVTEYAGAVRRGAAHGQGQIRFESTASEGGEAPVLRVRKGEFVDGCLNGWVTTVESDLFSLEEEFFLKGRETGVYRRVAANGNLLSLGCRMSGGCWYRVQEVEGKAYIFSQAIGDATVSVYLYPGLQFAVDGSFDGNSRLVAGQESIVCSLYEPIAGLPFPATRPLPLTSCEPICFERPSSVCLGVNLRRRDLVEHLNCYVDESSLGPEAGEGLFAKRDLPAQSLVALFNGLRKRKIFREVPSSSEEGWSDYCLALDKNMSLDIPKDLVSATNYCATVGHKACHSFEPNARFGRIFHPRFGVIMAIFALKDLKAGQELLVNYRYPIRTAPVWYRNMWHRYLRSNGWSLQLIERCGYEAHEVASTFSKFDQRFGKSSGGKHIAEVRP